MFESIALTGLAKSPSFAYAAQVPFFQGKRKLSFKPGLNILVGPNGSGKSTVLKILGESVCATQGGVSAVTETAVRDGVNMLGFKGERMQDRLGLKVRHDGQPAVFCDPRQAVGLSGGAFDDDFFVQGMEEAVGSRRRSHGQQTVARANAALAILLGPAPFPTRVERRIDPKSVNSLWQEGIATLEKRLVASLPKGQPSVLLDEPEANYSIAWQARLWSLLADEKLAQRFQIIVATHSAFALGIRHAHYIDVAPGFRQEAEAALRARFG